MPKGGARHPSTGRAAGVAWCSLTRLVETGLLEQAAHGVCRVRGTVGPDYLDLRAAWLQLDAARPAWERLAGPDVAVVSHASAASLYGVGDLRADVHEFTIPFRRQTRRPDVRIHRSRIPRERWILLGGLPMMRAGWMLGQLLADHVDPGAVAQITREVPDRVLDYPRDVADALAPYARRFGLERGYGVALLDEFLRRVAAANRQPLIAEARSMTESWLPHLRVWAAPGLGWLEPEPERFGMLGASRPLMPLRPVIPARPR